jgi:hypothetical protein
MEKVKIELTPHDAVAIASFLGEFTQEFTDPVFESLSIAVKNYTEQVYNITTEQFEDAVAETRMYQLIGKAPRINKNGEDAL